MHDIDVIFKFRQYFFYGLYNQMNKSRLFLDIKVA